LRGFGGAFDPDRRTSKPPAPEVTGARRRASRQMKNEISPSTTSAPTAITIALLPLNELEPAGFVAGFAMTGAVCVGVVAICGCGNADSGLFGLAAAAAPTEPAGLVVVAEAELVSVLAAPFASAADGPARPSANATSRAAARCTADRLNLDPRARSPFRSERLLHRGRRRRIPVGLLVLGLLLVVHAFDIDRPDVVMGSE
jgi:hypothetical protein